MTLPNLGPRALLAFAVAAVAAWGAQRGCYLRANDRTVLDAWFTCIECDAGELRAVTQLGRRREAVVIALADRLRGPGPAVQGAARNEYEMAYADIMAYRGQAASAAGRVAYVQPLVDGLHYRYRLRAAVGLVAVDTWLSRFLIEQARNGGLWQGFKTAPDSLPLWRP